MSAGTFVSVVWLTMVTALFVVVAICSSAKSAGDRPPADVPADVQRPAEVAVPSFVVHTWPAGQTFVGPMPQTHEAVLLAVPALLAHAGGVLHFPSVVAFPSFVAHTWLARHLLLVPVPQTQGTVLVAVPAVLVHWVGATGAWFEHCP